LVYALKIVIKTVMRQDQFLKLYPEASALRLKQIQEALFRDDWRSWEAVSVLPAAMRADLAKKLPWMSCKEIAVLESRKKDTYKAVVEVTGGSARTSDILSGSNAGGHRIETVLMLNARGHWTVCVSSQVGCAMACSFCATGKMGFLRNLTADEIVDQYRFWKYFLAKRPHLSQHISNMVFMGMGEPLANYDHVREALGLLLKYTDMGPTRITVSTVGLVPMLEKMLKDPLWPPVRLAVSLHSADPQTRKEIMPSSYDGFLDKLADWTQRYFAQFKSRRRHLTFEYIMLAGVNDTRAHAEALARFAHRVGRVRINLIPYNFTGSIYSSSSRDSLTLFAEFLEKKGVVVTRRRTMGEDIAAACGQLIVEGQKEVQKTEV
jgi:23S rRNA (adenine2503-C2)-methyltransferase